MAHRKLGHAHKRTAYMFVAEQKNKLDDVGPLLEEYSVAFEGEADIVGCFDGGSKICSRLIDSFRPRTIPGKNFYIPITPTNDSRHPPIKKRIKKLEEIMNDMQQEALGRCLNRRHKINGLPRWLDCSRLNAFKFEK